MTPLLAAVCGSCLVGGLLLAVAGMRRVPDDGRPSAPVRMPRPVAAMLGSGLPEPQRRRRQVLLLVALAGGVLTWLLTGWAIAVVVLPLLVVGVPVLLGGSGSATDVARLTAIEQWTRGMSGVLTVGSGIEHAIAASVGSTPPANATSSST